MLIRWVLLASALTACAAPAAQLEQPQLTMGSPLPSTRLFISDLDSSTVDEVYMATHHGVAVVAYDGRSLHVLPFCLRGGSYQTHALPMQETSSSLGGGGHLVMRVRGEGTATLARVNRSTLLGPGCLGATHFISHVQLGAYASNGHIQNGTFTSGLGELDACRRPDDAGGPPVQCRWPVTVDLVAVQ